MMFLQEAKKQLGEQEDAKAMVNFSIFRENNLAESGNFLRP